MIYKRNRRTSQEVWQTLKNSTLQKKFTFGFNNPGKTYAEKVAVFRFTELLPESDFEIYLIQSSQQPVERKAIWSDFQIYKKRTKNYYYSSGFAAMSWVMALLGVHVFNLMWILIKWKCRFLKFCSNIKLNYILII